MLFAKTVRNMIVLIVNAVLICIICSCCSMPAFAGIASVYGTQNENEEINISDCTVTLAYSEFIIDGKVHTPRVTVMYDGKKLVKNTDYTLKYRTYKWTEAESTVKVTGTGDYTGIVIMKYYGKKKTEPEKKETDKNQNKTKKKVKKKSKAKTYKVRFMPNGGTGSMTPQKIEVGKKTRLKANRFRRDGYTFAGWSTRKNRKVINMKNFRIGKVSYSNRKAVRNIAGANKTITLYAVWDGSGPQAAVDWAEKIANDNSFTYGSKPATSRVGCYFCGTNKKNKPCGYEKTYVCMTFVTAAYAHGARDKDILSMDRQGRYCLSSTDSNFRRLKCWKKVGRCSTLKVSDLKAGDVIVWWADDNRHGHMSMYAGKGNIIDSTGGNWSADSIAVRRGRANAYLKQGARHDSRSYVMRYKNRG